MKRAMNILRKTHSITTKNSISSFLKTRIKLFTKINALWNIFLISLPLLCQAIKNYIRMEAAWMLLERLVKAQITKSNPTESFYMKKKRRNNCRSVSDQSKIHNNSPLKILGTTRRISNTTSQCRQIARQPSLILQSSTVSSSLLWLSLMETTCQTMQTRACKTLARCKILVVLCLA